MSLRGKINIAEITDVGKVRDHNEDAIGSNSDIGLLVLADGMGGYNAGEVASGIAVQTITELAAEGAEREERNDIDPSSGFMRQTIVLRDAIARANKIIFQTAQSQTHCEGMGTTLVACRCSMTIGFLSPMWATPGLTACSDANRFEQLTMDHSLLQELVDRGFLLAMRRPSGQPIRNYVTRALGVEPACGSGGSGGRSASRMTSISCVLTAFRTWSTTKIFT